MFGRLVKQLKAISSSFAEHIALIEKICATLGTHYRSLKQYNCHS